MSVFDWLRYEGEALETIIGNVVSWFFAPCHLPTPMVAIRYAGEDLAAKLGVAGGDIIMPDLKEGYHLIRGVSLGRSIKKFAHDTKLMDPAFSNGKNMVFELSIDLLDKTLWNMFLLGVFSDALSGWTSNVTQMLACDPGNVAATLSRPRLAIFNERWQSFSWVSDGPSFLPVWGGELIVPEGCTYSCFATATGRDAHGDGVSLFSQLVNLDTGYVVKKGWGVAAQSGSTTATDMIWHQDFQPLGGGPGHYALQFFGSTPDHSDQIFADIGQGYVEISEGVKITSGMRNVNQQRNIKVTNYPSFGEMLQSFHEE